MTASSLTLGTTFDYVFPNRYIDVLFLRIHIMDVVTRADLATKYTGFGITEIYGTVLSQPNNSKSNYLLVALSLFIFYITSFSRLENVQ